MAITDMVAVGIGVLEKMGVGERVGDMVAVRVCEGVAVWVEV